MLNKLFRPKWQHENPEIRKSAIEKLTGDDTTILEQLALEDTDSSVRHLAIQHIDDFSKLENIIHKTTTANDKEFAIKCWAIKLTQSDVLSAVDIEQHIIDCTDEEFLAGIIAWCEDDNLRELALSGINTEEKLLSLMQQTKSGRVWQAIISKLQTEKALKTAQSVVKGRDKKSTQIIKTRLDEIKQQRTNKQIKEDQAKHLLDKLEGLLRSEYNPLFEGVLLTAKKQWTELSGEFDSTYTQKISTAIAACENHLKENELKQIESQEAAEKDSQESTAINELLKQINNLKKRALKETSNADSLQLELDKLNNEWKLIQQTSDANQHLFENSKKIIEKVILANNLLNNEIIYSELSENKQQKLNYNEIEMAIAEIQSHLNTIHWPDKDDKPEVIKSIEDYLQKTFSQKNKLEEQAKKISKDIKTWMTDIDHLIEKNELASAVKIQKQIRSGLSKLPEEESKRFTANFQRINQAIHALEDWKDYATDPKREALAEEMKGLIDIELPPPSKAENIKKLQQEWKSLGPCHNQNLWEQFKTYADEAYIPCQKYFEQQKQQRQFNAQQRTIICEQLETFISQQTWEDCDWKEIEKLYKAIQDEWKKFSPVERQDHKPLQDRYFKSLNIIKEKLNEERQENTKQLKILVDKARQLQNLENIQEAIEQYQKIHDQWKKVGITFRKEQQQQWKALKTAGDALYDTRQNLRQEADNERKQKLEAANNLCKEITQLCQLNDDELSVSRATFNAYCSSFRSIDNLPKEYQRTFNEACKSYEDAINNISKRTWVKQLGKLEQLALEWNQSEIAGQKPVFDLTPEDLPDKWKQQLQNRLTSEASPDAEKLARTLCIELEILCDTETPEEDSSLKMEIQMAKLAKNFGSQPVMSFEDKLEDLYLQWFSQPCWDQDTHKKLTERFLATAKKSLQKYNL